MGVRVLYSIHYMIYDVLPCSVSNDDQGVYTTRVFLSDKRLDGAKSSFVRLFRRDGYNSKTK